jgi:hypothetical protein
MRLCEQGIQANDLWLLPWKVECGPKEVDVGWLDFRQDQNHGGGDQSVWHWYRVWPIYGRRGQTGPLD